MGGVKVARASIGFFTQEESLVNFNYSLCWLSSCNKNSTLLIVPAPLPMRFCQDGTSCCWMWLGYVVDAADRDSIPIARSELYELLIKPSLSGIPLLVLGNKIDKSEAISKQALVQQMGLELIKDREVCCYMISCKESINIDVVMDWLIKHSRSAR